MYIGKLIKDYPVLDFLKKNIEDTCFLLEECFQNKGKLLIAGNGGSAADADHIAGEMLKGFMLKRYYKPSECPALTGLTSEETVLVYAHLQKGLPTIPLSTFSSFMTAYINDENPDLVYAQQISVLGYPGDVFWGISTSGNSKNIVYAMTVAKSRGLKTIALVGANKGRVADLADVVIAVPSLITPEVQELHLPVYHAICATLEQRFFGE